MVHAEGRWINCSFNYHSINFIAQNDRHYRREGCQASDSSWHGVSTFVGVTPLDILKETSGKLQALWLHLYDWVFLTASQNIMFYLAQSGETRNVLSEQDYSLPCVHRE